MRASLLLVPRATRAHRVRSNGDATIVPDPSLTPTARQDPSRPRSGASADDNAELATWLQRTRDAERAALARELHDELGAILTAARLDAAWLAAQPGCQSPAIAKRLDALQRVLAQGIGLKRRIVEDLHPSVLTHLGLVAALEQLVATHRERFTGRIDVALDESVALSAEGELALYRIAQEALTNIQKYANAQTVRIGLRRGQGRVELLIRDDGRGFEPQGVGCGHHGLAGMRQRMLALGGRIDVSSAPGAGTQIRASLAVAPKTRDARASESNAVERRGPAARHRAAPAPGHPPSPLHS